MKKILLFSLSILIYSGIVHSQTIHNKCEIAIDNLVLGKTNAKDAIKNCKNDTIEIIALITNSINDSINYETYKNLSTVIAQLSQKNKNSSIKQNAIIFFLKNLSNKNSTITTQAIHHLRKFSKTDFDSTSVGIIEQHIDANYTAYKDIVLLAGYVGNQNTSKKIKEIFPNGRNYTKPERWATYIALSRLGDESSLEYCISRVESLPTSDQVVDILYKDLVYTRRKEVYNLMVKTIFSDEKLCTSSNPNSDAKIICGYRTLELIAPYIDNFPIKVLESGDLATDNYPKALEIAREWFQNNKESYIIVDENY